MNSSKPLISIIIVSWNGLHWLKICIKSIMKQSWKGYEIIIIDNGSCDGTKEWLRKKYPGVILIRNTRNIGFAAANNQGYKKAKGKYILFLNNDTKLMKHCIREAIRQLENDPLLAGVQSKLLLMDNPKRLDSIGAFLTPTGFLYHYGYGKRDEQKYQKSIQLYTAKGACMFFKRDVLEMVAMQGNIFEPEYFAYFEETDMCHRVWLAGYSILYAPLSVVLHKTGATSLRIDNALVQYHAFKNRINSYIKNLNTYHLVLILPMHLLLCIMYSIISFFRLKWDISKATLQAIYWNITNLKSTLKKRKYVQSRIRKKTDEDIWPMIYRAPKLSYYWNLLRGAPEYD